MLLTIKAVLFDMGDTILKYDADTSEKVFQKILASLGIPRSLDEVKAALLKCVKEAEDGGLLSSFGKIQREEYRCQWNSLVLKHLKMTENEEFARDNSVGVV